ncbi:MAG: hypothetical protein LBR34_10245 [Prevotella sp.]|jgi:uncharacterized protein YfaP (DUF2135 family)|nr:hypothetical protein [Prevotella sp.]
MKKVREMMAFIVIAAATVVSISSCSSDDDKSPSVTPIEQQYFTIANAEVRSGAIPSATTEEAPAVNIMRNALAGGSSTVTIQQDVREVYVSVRGQDNYFVVSPSASGLRAAAEEVYTTFVLQFSQNLDQSFQIQIAAQLADGSITTVYETAINYIEASTGGEGGLQVSLSFDALKDVDLYVITPDSVVIYYGYKGKYGYDENENYVQLWGLDIDSNAGCGIDSINNENIFIPKDYIVTGKYQVWVNMWSNCSPRTTVTNWVVVALRNGAAVPVTYGSNPSSGVYPVTEPSNGIGNAYSNGVLRGATKVMEFNLQGTAETFRKARASFDAPLSETAKMKLEIAGELR